MNLPRGKLIETLKGGPSVLSNVITGLAGRQFNGYIKADSVREEVEAHGVIIVLASKPVMALYIWRERIFGTDALRLLLRDSLSESSSLKIFSLPDEAQVEMNVALQKFARARIDFDRFDLRRESELLLAGGQPPAPEPSRPPPGLPSVPPSLSAAAQAGKLDEEADALYGSLADMGIDTADLRHRDEDLRHKEKELRLELGQKLRERDQLKNEEESFLKMDEVFSKLVRQREGELARKESEIARRMTELQAELARRARDIESRADDLQREQEQLRREKEEMRQREEKLLEMEKMFRRVLTNTEERLKRKEEELGRKEQELDRVVKQRITELEVLRNQVPARQVPAEVRSLEEALRLREESLKRKEGELEEKVQRFKLEVAELEKRRAQPAAGRSDLDAERAAFEEELRRLLRSFDALFDRLPEDAVDGFAASSEFGIYDRLMVRLGLAKK